MNSTTPRNLQDSSQKRSIPHRWWPALVIASLVLTAVLVIWLRPEVMRQYRVIATGITLMVATFLLVVWACLFSRFPGQARLTIALLVGLAVAFIILAVRIRGVSGDLVPILAFRWDLGPEGELPVEARADSEPAARSKDSGDTGNRGETIDIGESGTAVEVASLPALPGGRRDFAQFLGPERRAVVRGVRLARDWNRSPPELLWRQPIGAGWSAFSIAGARAYTQEQRGEEEVVVCYELRTGRIIWSHADPVRYSTVLGGTGPRATPTVTADRVYTIGAKGLLNCLERRTGKRVWWRNVIEENGGNMPDWGKSCSPLVLGQLVIVSAGGRQGRSLVAYDANTGDPVWSGGDDRSAYSSPVLAELSGKQQVLIFNKSSLAAHDPELGRVLWSYPWQGKNPNVAQPVVIGSDRVLVSTGYGVGSALLRIRASGTGGLTPELLWRNRNLKAKFTNVVFHQGFVYGLDDGILVCLDVVTGKRRWKAGRYRNGQMVLVEDLLLVTTESGWLVLIEPSPRELRELQRFRALEGRTWANPALSGPYLLWRSDSEATCYRLPMAGSK